MTKNELIKIYKEEKENGGFRIDKDLYNIIYHLYKCRLTELKDKDDFTLIYDNLYINNEIVDSDNIDDYRDFIIKKMGETKRTLNLIENIKSGFNLLLLNYYSVQGSKTILKNCFMILTPDYNPIGL